MKILILYQDYITLLDDLVYYLNKNNIEADSFDIVNWKFSGSSKRSLPLLVKILTPILRLPKAHGLLLPIFQHKVILNLAGKYDIIDIQYLGQVYDKIIPCIQSLNRVIKATLWGSDFYRIDNKRIEDLRPLLGMASLIQLPTKRMKQDFVKTFSEHESKVRIIHYGNTVFEVIKNFDYPGGIMACKKEFGISDDTIILTCGYNGSRGQQHLKILEAIADLDASLKRKIYLLLPMTYGTTANYLGEVKEQIKKLGVPYTIFTKWMNDNDIARLKLITDVAINIQVTDAFSASVQEHIFAGNVFVVGDWLPYDYLEENDIYHIKTNLDDLTEMLSSCLRDLNFHKQMALNNKEKIYSISSWENSIGDWVSTYRDLANE